MTITVTKNIEELDGLQPYWEKWQNHPNNDLAHFRLVCALHEEVVCPYVTVVSHGAQPCGLLAARLEQTSFQPSIGYYRPIRIDGRVLTVINQGMLGQVDEATAEALIGHLWSMLSSGESDAIVFHQLPEHSPLWKALLDYGPRWWCEKKPVWSKHRSMLLPEQTGFLLKKLKSKHRSWIRGRLKKLETDFAGNISWKWMSDFNDIPGICAQLEKVAAHTYQRGLGAGFMNDEEHRQRFSLFASRGQLRIQLLELDGKVRAFWIGTIYKNIFYSSETGYDQDLREYEPGTLIFVHMADELVNEGVKKLDFGAGDASYKQRFGDEVWKEGTVRMFAPTFKGMAIRTNLEFFRMLDVTGRHFLQRFGVLGRLKTIWRRRLTTDKTVTDER